MKILKSLIFAALLVAVAGAQTFTQGSTEVKISSVQVFTGAEATGFNQMVCARSSDAGVADLRIRAEITLADFQVVKLDQVFVRRTGADGGAWKYPTCQIIATTAVPLLQVTGLEVTPTRAEPVIVFVPSPRSNQ